MNDHLKCNEIWSQFKVHHVNSRTKIALWNLLWFPVFFSSLMAKQHDFLSNWLKWFLAMCSWCTRSLGCKKKLPQEVWSFSKSNLYKINFLMLTCISRVVWLLCRITGNLPHCNYASAMNDSLLLGYVCCWFKCVDRQATIPRNYYF